MEVFDTVWAGEREASRQGSRELYRDSLIGTRKRWVTIQLVKPSTGEDPENLTEEDAMAATGVPALRSIEGSAILRRKYAAEVDSINGIWEVSLEYDSHGHEQAEPPTGEDNVEYWWDAEEIEEVLEFDPVSGLPIVNSVGEPLPITSPILISVLNIDRIENSFDPDVNLIFGNHTNSATFWGAPAGTALMTPIRARPERMGGVKKWRVSYVIKFNFRKYPDPDSGEYVFIGWGMRLLNHGTKYKVATLTLTPDDRLIPGVGEFLNFTDMYKNPTTGNLATDGTALDSDDPAVYLNFNRFPRINLNALNLGPWD